MVDIIFLVLYLYSNQVPMNIFIIWQNVTTNSVSEL